MLRDHQLFIGRHDVEGNAAVSARDPRGMTGVLKRISDAPAIQPLRDPCPDADGVFADPCGKDKTIEALQGSRQQSGIKRNAMNKIVNGKSRTRVVAALSSRMSLLTPESPFRPQSRYRKS